jgi:hypothetical protein
LPNLDSSMYRLAPDSESALSKLGYKPTGHGSSEYCRWTKTNGAAIVIYSDGKVTVDWCRDLRALFEAVSALRACPKQFGLIDIGTLRKVVGIVEDSAYWAAERAKECEHYGMQEAEQKWLDLAAERKALGISLSKAVEFM